ncbi:MAG: hypothetical protein WBZ36_30370 [Candidatus Nitrosopolaris sp.]
MAVSKDDDRKKKAVDKSPVHATVIPTMDMTKKSESVVESGKEGQTIQKEDANELRGVLQTTKQVPNYQKVTINSESQNEADKIEKTKEITSVTDSLEGKTILEKQNETTAQPTPKSQDKEILEVRSTVPTEKDMGKQELNVQNVGASRKDSNLDRVELRSNMDYVFPFTYAMTIWQDFALSAVNIYNEFARELSRLHSNWMSIFLNVWQSSNYEQKRTEDK